MVLAQMDIRPYSRIRQLVCLSVKAEILYLACFRFSDSRGCENKMRGIWGKRGRPPPQTSFQTHFSRSFSYSLFLTSRRFKTGYLTPSSQYTWIFCCTLSLILRPVKAPWQQVANMHPSPILEDTSHSKKHGQKNPKQPAVKKSFF